MANIVVGYPGHPSHSQHLVDACSVLCPVAACFRVCHQPQSARDRSKKRSASDGLRHGDLTASTKRFFLKWVSPQWGKPWRNSCWSSVSHNIYQFVVSPHASPGENDENGDSSNMFKTPKTSGVYFHPVVSSPRDAWCKEDGCRGSSLPGCVVNLPWLPYQ